MKYEMQNSLKKKIVLSKDIEIAVGLLYADSLVTSMMRF